MRTIAAICATAFAVLTIAGSAAAQSSGGGIVVVGTPVTSQACPVSGAFEPANVYAHYCGETTAVGDTGKPQYGLIENLTAAADTPTNEVVAGGFYTTCPFGAPDCWGIAADIEIQPGATAAQDVDADIINENCDPGTVFSTLSTRCPYAYANLILDGIDNGGGSNATFTGIISGTALSVSSVSGTIAVGQTVYGTGVALGTKISSGSGPSWTLSISQTVGSEAMGSADYYPGTSAILVEPSHGGILDHVGITLSAGIDVSGFDDLTNDASIMRAKGSHTNGIDFSAATFSGPVILVPVVSGVSAVTLGTTVARHAGALTVNGPFDSSSGIVAAFNGGGSGLVSLLHYTDGATYNLCAGSDGAGDFIVQSACYDGHAGANELSVSPIGNVVATNSLLSAGAGGVGYQPAVGAGGAVTQSTSRTTGVTLNKPTGAITMFTAVGSATPATFTVTDSAVAATDTIVLNEKSGTNLYEFFVTAVTAGSFNVTFFTAAGAASDAPVVNFTVMKGAAS